MNEHKWSGQGGMAVGDVQREVKSNGRQQEEMSTNIYWMAATAKIIWLHTSTTLAIESKIRLTALGNEKRKKRNVS
jgi:hypothetical protein